MKADISCASIGRPISKRLGADPHVFGLASNHWKQWSRAERSRYRMVLDASNAGGVFGGNAQRPAFLLGSDDAPKIHDAV